ncbi:MAG: hypothetical protein J6W73_02525 [Verrucomicrobia bacterium]|nr:hypothetical protein [Verrucomicrobiota bacterium]
MTTLIVIPTLIVILVCSLTYWSVVLSLSALLNLILYLFFKRVDKWRLKVVFISCYVPYLTFWGLITGRGSLSNMYANPIYLALIMTALETIYLLICYLLKPGHKIDVIYLPVSLLTVILFTAYMPELPE